MPDGRLVIKALLLAIMAALIPAAQSMSALARLPLRGACTVASRFLARPAHLGRLRAQSATRATTMTSTATLATVPFPPAGAGAVAVSGAEGADAVRFGDHEAVMSQALDCRRYAELGTMLAPGGAQVGDRVWIRARVSRVRAKGNSCFLVLRQGVYTTLQACYFKDKEDPEASKAFLKWLGGLSPETIVDVQASAAPALSSLLPACMPSPALTLLIAR